MAAELNANFGVDAVLHAGGGGIFDVRVDGELVYSKLRTGRFPDVGEVSGLISPRYR